MFGRALIILLGILSGPGVFPLARSLRPRSKTSLVNWDAMLWFLGPLFSSVKLFK